MGLTSAMYTGLTGLDVNQTRIETIGHNIANVNTTAFHGSRTLFQTQFSQILSAGTPPSDTSGGTNPMQIGHGAMVGTTQRNLNSGSLETTGLAGDLAIEGSGYFVVQSADGRRYYTRDGSFALNSRNELVSVDGHYVMGYAVDQNFALRPGSLQPIRVPVGQLSLARPTANVLMDGDLSAAETIATRGSAHTSQALVSGGGAPAAADTTLTDLRSAASPGTVLFADGDVITVSGVTKGERSLPAAQFAVGTTGTTLGDFASWLESTFGIQTDADLPGSPGVVIENGSLVINSNAGSQSAIQIAASDITSSNPASALPFEFTQTAEADGEGVFTSFTVYDSLGNPVSVSATFVLEATPNTGPVWRYYLESDQAGAGGRALGTGTLAFDTEGGFTSAAGNQFSINRSGSGAATPLTVTLDFSALNGLSTSASNVIMSDQDGSPPGTLTNFTVGTDGTITGLFSNGLARTLGQIPLATFANDGGLVAETDNLFSIGPNSGAAAVKAAGTLGAGLIRGGALEMSNVDLSREFIGLITSSTGFQASSRVISVSNEMLDQLLMTLR
jgi:flagellar hook protein FlgE